MIIGMVKGRSFSILGLDRDYITTGSVGLKIGFVFDDEWNGLAKTVVFQNGTIIKTAAVQNGECTVPFEVLVNPGAKLKIGIRGVNGVDVVIPTIYTEVTIYQGTGDTASPGGSYTPSEIEQIQGEIGDLSELETTEKSSLVEAINELAQSGPGGTGVSESLKAALLQLAANVAYDDMNGETYYQALYDALYPSSTVVSITAVFDPDGHTIYTTDSLNTLRQYLTVTALHSDSTQEVVTGYTLSGSMAAGTNTIVVSYNGKSTTFTVTVIEFTCTSISAVFTQGAATIYDTDSLETLKQYLSVSAYYSDGTSAVLADADYVLSGSLTSGTSVITATYAGQTDTFNVVVTHDSGYYSVTNNLTNCTTNNQSSRVTENTSYSATITAASGYTLTGAAISITMGGVDVTSTAYSNGAISIASVTGALVITIAAVAVALSSISAVYAQGGTVYDSDSLDSLREDLVVTALYSDSSTAIVTTYTLSGTLTVGTSTITVSYGGQTDTFTVTVSAAPLVPTTYQQVEYIESLSTASSGPYFNTGYSPTMTGDLVLEIDCMCITLPSSTSSCYVAGVNQTGTNSNIGAGVYVPGANTQCYGVFNGTSCYANYGASVKDERVTVKGTFRSDGYEKIELGQVTNDATEGTPRSYSSLPVCLFGVKKSNVSQVSSPFKGRIYHAKVTENGVLKADLYPVYRKEDNVIGFYERVSGTFRTRLGSSTATITVGPDVTE